MEGYACDFLLWKVGITGLPEALFTSVSRPVGVTKPGRKGLLPEPHTLKEHADGLTLP